MTSNDTNTLCRVGGMVSNDDGLPRLLRTFGERSEIELRGVKFRHISRNLTRSPNQFENRVLSDPRLLTMRVRSDFVDVEGNAFLLGASLPTPRPSPPSSSV